MKSLLIAGYLCALVALFFVPPAFGIAALVIGIIVLAKGRVGHGVALVVIAVTCGFAGMYIGWIGLGNFLLSFQTLTSSQSIQSPVTQPTAEDWHIVSIQGRITSSDDFQTTYAWKLTIRNDATKPAAFNGQVEFQDANGFIVQIDTAIDMHVGAESEGVFTGYALMKTQDARKVAHTVANISRERW